MVLLVREKNDARALVWWIRQLIIQTDSNVLSRKPRLLTELIKEKELSDYVTGVQVSGAAGLFALILAGMGVYGVVSFRVSRRTREVGIRMALGSRKSDIVRMVLSQGLRFIIIGLPIGAAISVGVAKILAALFEGRVTLDALSLMEGTMVLTVAALFAALVPALRASKVDPMTALRHEKSAANPLSLG